VVVGSTQHLLWKAVCAFSVDAVKAVMGDAVDLYERERGGVTYIAGHDAGSQRLISDEQLQAIARASAVRYWTDGRKLFWDDGRDTRPASQAITATQALERFGLDALEEASEKGSWGWDA
jgi:hypothetical protein